MTDDDHIRRREAFVRRNRAARQQLLAAATRPDKTVGEDRPVTSFGKGLEHDADGVPTAGAYRSLVAAVEDGSVGGFNAVELAGDGVPGTDPADASRRLVEPNGALAFQDLGADPHTVQIRPHPAFSSDQTGAEMVELYWRARCRDVPFGEYETNPRVADAVAEFDGLAGYAGPRSDADPRGDSLSPTTVFRGVLPGAQTGPRISQFLWKDVPRAAIPLSQRARVLTDATVDGVELARGGTVDGVQQTTPSTVADKVPTGGSRPRRQNSTRPRARP